MTKKVSKAKAKKPIKAPEPPTTPKDWPRAVQMPPAQLPPWPGHPEMTAKRNIPGMRLSQAVRRRRK